MTLTAWSNENFGEWEWKRTDKALATVDLNMENDVNRRGEHVKTITMM